jgi:hypothetical protein
MITSAGCERRRRHRDCPGVLRWLGGYLPPPTINQREADPGLRHDSFRTRAVRRRCSGAVQLPGFRFQEQRHCAYAVNP